VKPNREVFTKIPSNLIDVKEQVRPEIMSYYEQLTRALMAAFQVSKEDRNAKIKTATEVHSEHMMDALSYALGLGPIIPELCSQEELDRVFGPRTTTMAMATSSGDIEQEETVVADYEVWVTPYTRYLHVPKGDLLDLQSRTAEDGVVVLNPTIKYLHSDKENSSWVGVGYEYFMLEMSPHGQAVVKAFEKNGVRVRLKEVSKPRFGETFWMETNGLKEWK
jgi:hypothetical protein